MSYILEALKKAQAERQLGSAPTIHAPSAVHAAPVSAASRKPLLVGVAAGAVLAAAAVIVAWRHQSPAPAVPASAPPASEAGNAASLPQAEVAVAGTPPEAARSVAGPPVAPVPAARAPAALVPAPAAGTPAKSVSAPIAGKAVRPPEAAVASVPVPASPVPAVRAPAPTPVVEKPAAPAAEDNVRTLAELPEAIQREVPRVAFGGYIYSPNPADRLLLVDKALRHEGEEVAPGLVLEKLLPKAAVMNFRGYRYRVAY